MCKDLQRLVLAASSLIMGGLVSAQVNDLFDDGDFNLNPTWSGSDALFTVATGQLRSNSPGAANYYLSTPSTQATNAQWDYFINLKFSTSGANYADVYLMSSAADLQSGVDGYFVRMGGTTDRIELFRSDAGVNTSLIVSPDGIVNSSTNNPFRIEVKRQADNTWTLLYDDGALGTFSTAGQTIDATYTLCTHFGSRIEQSTLAGAVNNHYFDDFAVGPLLLDITPPSIVNATIISSTEIDVLFSEPVDQTTAEDENNYNITPFNSAAAVVRDLTDLALVHITLSLAMQSGNTYTIAVNGVEDPAANPCVNESIEVLYFIPDIALPGEVVMNELMPDPTPAIGIPDAEFIEIYNATTTKTFDLANWTISDGSSTGTLPSVALPPGGYAILTDDVNAALFTGFGTVVSIPTFPSLNNDGDPLELANENSTVIDAVSYELGWYNDAAKAVGGWSLERIDPTTPCSNATNWTACNDPQGGTPGAENSVFAIVPDVTAPSLLSVIINSDTQLELVFNETMNSASLAAASYTLNPPIAITLAQPTGDSRVLLSLAPALTLDQSYTITITGVSDCVGNVAPTIVRNFLYFIPDVPTFRSVVINEIFPDPSPQIGLPGVEFVEVFNASTDQIYDLGGWTFGDAGSQTVLPSVILGPGQYGVIMDDADTTAFFFVNRKIPVGSFPSLNNDSDSLKLHDPNGVLIDEANYTLDWYHDVAKADGGWTMEQKDPFTPCSSVNNWRASTASNGGTPGTQNSAYDLTPDTQAPALTNVFVNSSTVIQLVFDEPMNAASLSIGVYTFDPVLTVTQVDVIDPTNVQLSLGQSLPVGQLYVITVVGVSDCPGNLIGNTNTFTFALPEPALAGDVVINEVLYDPRGSGSDFVELYNRSNKVLSLGNWDLANETDGIIDNATPITTTAQVLLPGQYALISESSANIASEYPLSRTDRFIETGLPSYNNGAGVVVLQDPLGNVLDRFAYDDALHFELLNSTDGVSLERVDPNRPTDEFTNWHSAAQSVGYATPGYKNSQYSEPPDPSGELTIDPKIFSPDNDGYQDLLTLAYRLNQPGFTGTMIVFDVAGREVIKLMDNELLGTSGAVSWNGIMETGDLARMGPYVVYFEAFDLSGNVEKFRETVVLAHKLN